MSSNAEAPATAPLPLDRRIGIIQGRLVASASGELQCSPGSLWREEFAIASDLGLSHIEIIAERFIDPANPIWSADGRAELMALAAATGVRPASLCQDETMSASLQDPDFAADMTRRLVPVIDELGTKIVVIPMYEASDLEVVDWSVTSQSLRLLAREMATVGARVVLELGVPQPEGRRFLDVIDDPNVGVCYDTGNSTAFGYDVLTELRAWDAQVWHVHAKDKNPEGYNVRYGTGAVPFEAVFAILIERGYDGLVSMEATRGENPVVTAAQHREFLLAAASPLR